MKTAYFLVSAAFLGLAGCSAPQNEVAPPTEPISAPRPTSPPTPAGVATPTSAAPLIVRSNRASLPPLPQMMDNSPRPTFVPLPTPKIRPGQTIVISNARTVPTPRENPTIIVSNAPVAGTAISPQAAAARGLVWVNVKSRIYHRPGSQFYGGTIEGFYSTETQAIGRGYRASQR